MMKRLGYVNKRHIALLLILLTLLCSFFAIHMVQAVTGEPGTDANPLVSQDYVDTKLAELTTKLNELAAKNTELVAKNTELAASVDNLNKLVAAQQQAAAPKFEVIELEPGKTMLLGASTEIVLRGGKATAISGEKGGLSSLTAGTGVDIITGQPVPLNHLILSSRNDGRGIKATVKCWVLVKGEYTVK
ncbi:MAG: hypothetical protein N2489_01520 [Clostridia bacterium]|nr:hypothetical protein [Clostridia bacterium]